LKIQEEVEKALKNLKPLVLDVSSTFICLVNDLNIFLFKVMLEEFE